MSVLAMILVFRSCHGGYMQRGSRVRFQSRFRTCDTSPDSSEVYTAKVGSQLPFLQIWLQWSGVEGSTWRQIYS